MVHADILANDSPAPVSPVRGRRMKAATSFFWHDSYNWVSIQTVPSQCRTSYSIWLLRFHLLGRQTETTITNIFFFSLTIILSSDTIAIRLVFCELSSCPFMELLNVDYHLSLLLLYAEYWCLYWRKSKSLIDAGKTLDMTNFKWKRTNIMLVHRLMSTLTILSFETR